VFDYLLLPLTFLTAFLVAKRWLAQRTNALSDRRQADFNEGYRQGYAEAMSYAKQEILRTRPARMRVNREEKVIYVEREVERDEGKRVEHLKGALRTVTEQRDTAARTIEELRAKLEAKPKRKSKPKVGIP